ncbi:hypothetical protein Mapa_004479 [Marchantia paleacea]|nr:hypothetical protein Mapa_004479 [Marchantia paleacea]
MEALEGGGEGELSKLDLAQEAQALRRVVSAYLNYASAGEEDILRWERSYSKLKPHHKLLLKHLPSKYAQVRSCVEANMFFIHHVLQAFSPPFDMGDFTSGAVEKCQSISNFDHSGVGENRILQGDTYARGPRFPSEDLAVGDGFGNSSTVVTTDEMKKPCVSQRNDERMDPRTSNKRQASEISHEDWRSVEESGEGRRTDNRHLTSHNIRPSLNDIVRITENGIKEHQDFDETSQAKDMVSDRLGANTRDFFMDRNVDTLPSDVGHVDDSDDMETGYTTIWYQPNFQLPVPPADVDKVRCIIRNIVRDWSEEGVCERAECYTPILKELEDWFPNRSQKRPPTCLVPGAGLGRLAFEISRLGFVTQGNEFSYYMMICSSFILNGTQEALEWEIYPWIHSSCNTIKDEHQLRCVRFPDLHPGSAEITEGFSMCAGDFVEVYRHPDQKEAWDAVVTCFFIDTAHNILEYLEIIARILKPGGVWINLGPLLYHFADSHMCSSDDELSIELSLDDVKTIAGHYGLVLKREKVVETTYSSNIKSMMQNRYFAAFWTMVKEKIGVSTNGASVRRPEQFFGEYERRATQDRP